MLALSRNSFLSGLSVKEERLAQIQDREKGESEFDALLGADSGVKRVFDLAHFRNQIGRFD